MTHPPPAPPDPRPDPGDLHLDQALQVIAPFYDLDFGAIDADLPMYENFARAAGPRLLELGTGAGRVAAPLARAGCRVVGLEASAAMRDAGRDRLRVAGVTVVAGDMRCPPAHPALTPAGFDLALCALSGFCHLPGRDAQLAALRTVARLLRPGGRLILDLPALQADDWTLGPRPLQLEWVRPHPHAGHTVMKWATLEAFPARQSQIVTYLYDELRPQGGFQRVLARFPLRHIFRFELEGLLEAAGLNLESCYGSYDLDDVETGDRLIAVAVRPFPPAASGTATRGAEEEEA